MLIILDGWGINPDPKVSAVEKAETPYIDSLMKNCPNSTLDTFGEKVGLPGGQMGNSEVGHMNLGAGRIVYQDLLKINMAIENKELSQNQTITDAIVYAKRLGKKIHLMGLTSDGGVHSHIEHTMALTSVFREHNFKNVAVHLFTDGRDTDPKAGISYIKKLEKHLASTTGEIASITGRYYAMDRDTRWERTALAYNAIVNGTGETSENLKETVKKRYKVGETDEFLQPIVHIKKNGEPVAKLANGDVVIFTNFRGDRARQLTEVLTQEDHPDHGMKKMDLYYVTFKAYDESYENIRVIFEGEDTRNTMGEVLANLKKKQLRIAETEKYPHVTYFFNNGREEPFEGEDRIVVPSPRDVATYDEKPEMSAYEVTDELVNYLENNDVDFVCLNFANPDMVAHTGDFDAAVKACEVVDSCTKKVVEKALDKDFSVIIIADHGNADYMINDDGTPNTNHSTFPVPCIAVSKYNLKSIKHGKLGDVAPTLLTLMEIPVPEEMTGEILIEK